MYLAAIFFLAIGILAVIGIALILMLIAGIVLLVVGIVKKRQYKKNGMVKKYPKVCIVLGTILTIIPISIVGYVGISSILKPSDNGYNPDTYDPHTAGVYEDQEYMEEVYVKDVLRCLDEEDVDGFKELFSEYAITQMNDLDEQIQTAMEVYDGKTVSYEKVDAGSAGGHSYGHYYRKSISTYIEGVVTDTGKKYIIFFKVRVVVDEDISKEGMTRFVIIDAETDEKVVKIGNINY